MQRRKHWQGRRKLVQKNGSRCQVKKGTWTLPRGLCLPRDSRTRPSVAAVPITASYFRAVFATLHFWGSQPTCLPELQQGNEMHALFSHALPQACVCLDCVVFCLPGSCSMLRTGDSSISQRTWGSEGARDRPGSECLFRGKASGCSLHQGTAVSTCCLSTKFAARNTRGNT